MVIHRHGAERRIIAEQAAQWVCDLRDASFERQAEFLAWLKQSPQHVTEFFFADTIWREVENSSMDIMESLKELEAGARVDAGPGNVVPLGPRAGYLAPRRDATREGQPASRIRGLLPPLAAVAASCALVALALCWAFGLLPSRAQTYATAVGEQRAFKLADGSLLHLNTHSRVEVRFSDHARRLRLLEGEALFTVERDAARPFLVDAGRTVIQALGTQFNVYRRTNETKVAVLSGAVQVSTGSGSASGPERDATRNPAKDHAPTRLSAGQEMHISASGEILQATPDVENALAWRERRLVFRSISLAEVASEFNRYNQRRIRVEGDDARRKLLSGTFDADNPESLVLFLRKLDDLAVESSDSELVIRVR